MTYQKLKYTVQGLLVGDTVAPDDNDVYLALLDMAYSEVATRAEALHLFTLNKNEDILRLAAGKYVIRLPKLPENLTDILDIDHELCFPVARIISSYISKEKGGIHKNAANRLILDYNAKVFEILETMSKDETTDTCVIGL